MGNTYSVGRESRSRQTSPLHAIPTVTMLTTRDFEVTPKPGQTMRGEAVQQCTEPSNVHRPVAV